MVELSTLVRERLSQLRRFYVRPDGSDANSGLTSTPRGAFKSITKALDVAWGLDTAGNDIYIEVADGTYTAPVYRSGPNVGGGRIIIRGNNANPSNVVLNVTGNGVQAYNGATLYVEGVKIIATARAMYAAWGGVIYFNHVDFGPCGSYHLRATAGQIWCTPIDAGDTVYEYRVSGGAPAHYSAHDNGTIYIAAPVGVTTVTLLNNPAFTEGFARADSSGALELSSVAISFVGAATGPRYYLGQGGSMNFSAGNPDAFLPGDAPGVTPNADIQTGPVNARGFYTGLREKEVADDGMVVFPLKTITSAIAYCTVWMGQGAKAAGPNGRFRARHFGSAFIENCDIDPTVVNFTTGALNGTTGVDGKFTISVHTDGNLYFENRLGAAKNISLMVN